jgi:uncharacterized protein YPO0396
VEVLVTLLAAALVAASAIALLESSSAIRSVIEERPAEAEALRGQWHEAVRRPTRHEHR